ncbi:alpha/beta fold hydrolase [Paracoccus fistulariae]|uniref:Alpha/beta hydrolase n=1 Tax=Paracoccus fistulariae TaxID=658446 RepID=A0ABY7SMJ4_9RHOB|nr:alpha/beta hydrolase [Paracoccus fistulariae]MDB6180036.1 alpha/beta hydrolase [Paracoccus fistulariae]WCR08125.1 alpha/beta hydrolase [Paracoccus fistulariae]
MSDQTVENRKVPVWNGRVTMNVQIKGSGPDLVYFHPASGMAWDPFLDELAKSYRIHAPEFPGTTPGNPYDIHKIDDLADAVLIYEETLRGLGLNQPLAVGQSFGGMMALELASSFPEIFSRLVVLDPIGLWTEAHPVTNWIEAPAPALPAILFKNPASAPAQAMLALPEDPEAAILATAQLVWNLGATGKMVWPIPDKGLSKRLHRLTAPALIVWGEEDALISSAYAGLLGERIKGSRVEIIRDCGHIPQVEKHPETMTVVQPFLAA